MNRISIASLAVVVLAIGCAEPKARPESAANVNAGGQGTEAANAGAQAANAQAADGGVQAANGQAVDASAAANAQAADGGTGSAQGQQASAEAPLMAEQQFRVGRPPALAREGAFEAPVPLERKLKNGARLLLVPNHAVPLVAIQVRLLHGADAEAIPKAGLASLVAEAAAEGTKKRTAEKLARDIDQLAARINSFATLDSAGVQMNCLRETLEACLALLADVVAHPAFRAEDVERVRSLRLARLAQKQASIGQLAQDEARRLLYGEAHPWGQPGGGTPASVQALTRADLAAHHAAWWVPNDAVISVSGDIEPDEATAQLEKAFASWKKKALPKLALAAPKPTLRRFVSAVDKPSATQSQVWMVGPLVPASHPDALALEIANNVIGGVFTSRLNLNLRERLGISYGVFSNVQLAGTSGAFFAQGGIVAKSTATAAAEYEKEVAAFATGDLSDVELQRARDTFVRSLPSQFETNDAVAGAMANLVVSRLPLDHYRTLAARAKALTRDEVSAAVKRHFKPDSWPVVIVGPLAGSRAELDALGFGAVEPRP